MSGVTAVIIAKNEEKKIGRALRSVGFCNEIVVIDEASKDKTVEIAKKYGARVFIEENPDFSQKRTIGKERARHEWVLYVDADEEVTEQLASSIKQQIAKNGNGKSAFRILRKNFYLGEYEWPYIESLERLFKKDTLEKWYGVLHESPVIKGEVGQLDGYLLHYTHTDLASMVGKTLEWSEREAKLRFNAHHPKMTWWRFPRVMVTAFFDSYIYQGGWKIGTPGLIESIYQAFSIFITYARLWEMQRAVKNKSE